MDRRVLQRYKEHELPWEMEVAYPHPICRGVIIAAAADMPHATKKQVNAVEFSGKLKSKVIFRLGVNAKKWIPRGQGNASTNRRPRGVDKDSCAEAAVHSAIKD